jgi:hypothetical protein
VGNGFVTVVSTSYAIPPNVQPYQDVNAGFFQVPDTCTGSSYGACTVTSCPPASPVSQVSAGIITITGTTPTLAVTLDSDGGYAIEKGDEPVAIWNGGETITASAPGSVVPPFTLSGVAPAPLDVQTPVLPSSGPIPVDRTAGLAFTWASNGGGTVMISLTVAPIVITCQLPQAPGGGVVPKAALQQLPASTQGTLSVTATGYFPQNVGGWALTLQLLGQTTWGGAPVMPSTFMTIN